MEIFCRRLLCGLVCLLLAACGGGPLVTKEKESAAAPESEKPSLFARIQKEILAPKCSGCHGAGKRIDLSNYATVMSGGWVVPFEPEKSVFYLCVHSGEMPKKNPQLSAAEVELIEQWIRAGAKEFD